jgi:hypothetical protein
MKQFFPFLSVPSPSVLTIAMLLALSPSFAGAQQALTWDQVKDKFEAANPVLKADAANVEEMKAEEITAFLRPNPQVGLDRAAQRSLDSLQGPVRTAQLQLPARARTQAGAALAERQRRHAD